MRAVLIGATGKMFCAGGDLKTFASRKDDLGVLLKQMTTYIHGAVSLLARMDAPVITAVHGNAAGGGLGLVFGADLVIAAESARFTMAYTRAALSPDASTSFFLPRLIGLRRALDLTSHQPHAFGAGGVGVGYPQPRGRGRRVAGRRTGAGQRNGGRSHARLWRRQAAAARQLRRFSGDPSAVRITHHRRALARRRKPRRNRRIPGKAPSPFSLAKPKEGFSDVGALGLEPPQVKLQIFRQRHLRLRIAPISGGLSCHFAVFLTPPLPLSCRFASARIAPKGRPPVASVRLPRTRRKGCGKSARLIISRR